MAIYEAEIPRSGTVARCWLVLQVDFVSSDIANNRSLVNWYLRVEKRTSGSPYHNDANVEAGAAVDGTVYSSTTLTYNFSGITVWNIGSGSKYITHNSNGTKTATVVASFNGKSPLLATSFTSTFVLPTIPRFSNDYFTGSIWDGDFLDVRVGSNWVQQIVEVYVGSSWVRQV